MRVTRRSLIGGALGLAGAAAFGSSGAALADPPYRGTPLRLKTLFTPPEIVTGNSFEVAGDLLYIANRGSDHVAIIDISTPIEPSVVSTATYDGAQAASSVTVRGGLAVVTDPNRDALGLIDVSQPANPQSLGSVVSADALTGAWHVEVKGNYAYVACRGSAANGNREDGVFTVVDISDRSQPRIVAVVDDDLVPEPRHLQLRGRYAYLIDEHRAGDFTGQGSFQIFDISDPTTPTRVSYLATPELLDARKVALSGSTAVVCGRDVPDARILSIDVRDPEDPVQLDAAGADGTRYTHGIAVTGRYAYLASVVDNSVSAWDISDPESIRLAELLTSPDLEEASEIVAHRRHLFVWARGLRGLAVLG